MSKLKEWAKKVAIAVGVVGFALLIKKAINDSKKLKDIKKKNQQFQDYMKREFEEGNKSEKLLQQNYQQQNQQFQNSMKREFEEGNKSEKGQNV